MTAPTNDVSQHALAAEVEAYLEGPPVREQPPEVVKLVSRFKTNAQDPSR